MIVRGAKYALNEFIRDIQSPHIPSALTHFLNVFIGGKGKSTVCYLQLEYRPRTDCVGKACIES